MLYIFRVDTGTMMTLEMRLVMETVGQLKKAIAMKAEIPEDKQVLLISGGESLNNSQRVGSYSSAGTDTSPIFLFAKSNIDSNQSQPMPSAECYGDDNDMTEMIESCMSMQPSLDTLVARTELAADLNEQAIKQRETCEKLVHDQHLQQQGWAAVTANLEDLTRAFKNKAEILMLAFGEFAKNKTEQSELLNKFEDDIKYLNTVPLLPALMENGRLPTNLVTSTNKSTTTAASAAELQSKSNGSSVNLSQGKLAKLQQSTSESSSSSTSSANVKHKKAPVQTSSQPSSSNTSDEMLINLKQWIDYHDNQNSLERLVELCWRGLDRFNETNAEQIRHEVHELLKSANNTSMKEIKGLEERLFGLEKLMVDAKKVVDEQSQLAASFQSNRERFSKIKDSTLLPDLSNSHKQQLQMMLSNHKKMNDYRNRCIKAKHELSVNLHNRLKWIMYVEQQISDLDSKLMIYRENLQRLNRHLQIVDQVHRCPDLYLEAVVEALRRRRFTRRYLHWANSIAKISQELYENEITIRKSFDAKLGSHFLCNLFPGLTRSYPPPFATVQPDPFDTKLPRITAKDIEYLQSVLSGELADKLQIPKDVPMPHIISAINNPDESPEEGTTDMDDRHSLNPTPPSSPTRHQV